MSSLQTIQSDGAHDKPAYILGSEVCNGEKKKKNHGAESVGPAVLSLVC